MPTGDKIIYVFYEKNLALSGAFNRVLQDSKYGWTQNDYVLFFDQDSTIEKGHVEGLIKEYELISADYKVGCIGPLYYDRNLNIIRTPRKRIKINDNSFLIDNNITSSLLCKYGDLQKISFWNEKIFLDMADWDLCWRFMECGYVCVRTKRVLLSHTVGDGEKKVGFIKLRKTAPVRAYYQTRNYLFLLGKKYVPLRFKIRFLKNLFIRPLLFFIFMDEKKKRLQYIFKGWRDFFKGYHLEYKG